MRIFIIALLIGSAVVANSQQSVPVEVQQAYARKMGTTLPLVEYFATSTPQALIKAYKANRPSAPNNFQGAKTVSEIGRPIAKPDPLLQDLSARASWRPGSPALNIEGISRLTSGSGVSDVNGDVSDKFYVQTVNATVLQVYDLMGNAVSDTFTTNAIWSQVELQGIGDPIILYDQEIDRWLLTELTFTNEVLIAVSESSDPLGSWIVYTLPTLGFPDYPKYGVWPGMYVLTTNELGTGGVAFYALNKDDLVSETTAIRTQRFSLTRTEHPGVEVCAPVGWIGDAPPDSSTLPMVLRINDDVWEVAPEDRLEVFEIDVDWEEPDSSSVFETLLPTTPFNAEFCEATENLFVCVPQPGKPFISAIPRVLWHRVSYRNFGDHGSIVLNFGVDASGQLDAGIRWMELRKENDKPWEIHQEGTIGSTDGENRFLGAISIDDIGNIGLGYAVSSERTFPSLRITGRREGDPLGQMTMGEIEIATGLDISNTPRFGDYHSMSVDSENMFWFTGQYVGKAEFWNTRIAGFRIVRDSIDAGIQSLKTPPVDSMLGEQEVSVDVKNYGSDTIVTLNLTLSVNGVVQSIDTADAIMLAPDSVYKHTFSEPITFDQFGDYFLEVTIATDGDANSLNDACARNVSKVAPLDAAAVDIVSTRSVECSEDIWAYVVFENTGLTEIIFIDYTLKVNGEEFISDVFETVLQPDERAEHFVVLEGLIEGTNRIEVIIEQVNQQQDGVAANDTLRFDQWVMLEGEPAELELVTDFFPQDTRWELQDSAGNVLYSGGPYTETINRYTEEWCIDQSKCYRFIVFDDGGDGLEFGGVQGDWRIFNQEGIAVAYLEDPAFGDSDTTEFCFESMCTISARALVTHETIPGANNGVISFITFGGVIPYEYSLDGGVTFQSFPGFTDLAPGDYQAIVRDRLKCSVPFQLTVLDCTVDATYEVTDASGADNPDGSILINAINGRGAFRYSIDSGQTFQPEPLFEQLLPDTFEVLVRDSLLCSSGDEVIVDFTTSSSEIEKANTSLSIYPNPSSEIFHLELRGMHDILVMPFEVVDGQGKVVVRGNAGVYDGVVRASFSLRAFPPGTYYIRLLHPEISKLTPLVKAGD